MHRPVRLRWPSGLRRTGMQTARVAFLLLVLAFAWWGLHDRGDQIRAGFAATSLPGVAAAAVLVVVGLLATSTAWLKLLAGFGHRLPPRQGRAVFFVGQLGKYIPGSVWSVSAHAGLARRCGVPLRSTVGTSLVYLVVNMATAGLVGGSVALSGRWHPGAPAWVLVCCLVVCLPAFVPALVNRAGSLVAGAGEALTLSPSDLAALVGLMVGTWACYAAALLALAPSPTVDMFPIAAGAFALAYVVGALVVVAPAGVGAREVTMVALLAPATGVGTATALALLTRALHTGGDLVLALVTWAGVRFGRAGPGSPTRRGDGLHGPTVGAG